ncbi:unnamed protein product [Rotaria sordida]|uniref:Uncharacterized protein n=1 Tax=Rotaria sordida TaxID=392033 RepID=A0A815TC83_9BILA|nr:unnamed protein product [Rotaria sordida]CAF1654805.1 unnamed protein product [Rotaria sordida]
MAQLTLPLRIIAQPKPSYRERYTCEIDRRRNLSQRFIRAETNPDNLDYPTIEIPKQWDSHKLYIRVTLVTVCSEQVPVTYIHPYPIDTSELNVIKDVERNALYFPTSEEELKSGRKSFRIMRRKLAQYELRNYGKLCPLDTDEKDISCATNLHNARRIIDTYQLGKSQLLFSIAELVSDDLSFDIYHKTSVYSIIMTANTLTHINNDESFVRCVPTKGHWNGGDDILMIIPKLDKRKACQIYFECPSSNKKDLIHFEFVDMKTIAFTTPPCPIQANGNQSIEIPIVVHQNDNEIARVNFLYQSYNQCSNCDIDAMLFDYFESSNSDEQSSSLDLCFNDADISLYAHDLLYCDLLI